MKLNCSFCYGRCTDSCKSKGDDKRQGIRRKRDDSGLPFLSDWEVDYILDYRKRVFEFRKRVLQYQKKVLKYVKWDDAYDPIAWLPDDPFEQNEGRDIVTAAIAAGFVRVGAHSGYYEIDVDDFLACCSLDETLWYPPETQFSEGGVRNGYRDGTFCVPSYGYWDENQLWSSKTQFSEGGDPYVYWHESLSALSVNESRDGVSESVMDIEQLPETSSAVVNACEDGLPHEGLTFALGYLGVKDLLSVERVCKSLHSAVQNDSLLWRCIHINSSLSEKITDNALFLLTQRAQGNLQCLSLAGCSRITDEGLRHVLLNNTKLRKLSVSGCLRLSLDGIIDNLKAFCAAGAQGLSCLKLGRLFSVSAKQFEELNVLLRIDKVKQAKDRKLLFYHHGRYSSNCDDECSIDIDICPLCKKYKLVYDCPSDSCQARGLQQCRACDVCIARCIQCGKCIKDSKYVETFFLEYQCSGCLENHSVGTEMNKKI